VLWSQVTGATGRWLRSAPWIGASLALLGGYPLLALLTGAVPRVGYIPLGHFVGDALARGGAGVSIETSICLALLGSSLVLGGGAARGSRRLTSAEPPALLVLLFTFGAVAGVIGISRDVTEQAELQQALQQSRGFIDVDSAPRADTTFTAYLPAASQAEILSLSSRRTAPPVG